VLLDASYVMDEPPVPERGILVALPVTDERAEVVEKTRDEFLVLTGPDEEELIPLVLSDDEPRAESKDPLLAVSLLEPITGPPAGE